MEANKTNNYGASFKRSPIFYIVTRIVVLFFLVTLNFQF